MKRYLRPFLLVAALLFSQHAAMLHGLAHAQHDIATATLGDGKAPALGHGADVCAAFGALAHALGDVARGFLPDVVRAEATCVVPHEIPSFTRVVFDPRAPPLSS